MNMKKILIVFILSAFTLSNFAQQIETSPIYYKDGKVGIGTGTPVQTLHVEDGELGIGDQSADNWLRLFQLTTDGFGYDIMYDNASVLVNEQGTFNEAIILGDVSNTVNSVLFGISHKQDADWIPKMTLTGLGNLGLGITEPAYKLDVKGTIRATEIKVESIGGADFVFEEDYKLRPLDEVETFIKTNKHLPEIPSAKQMEADGVNVAEMNKLLLQKVEELTLYVIDMNKEMNVLKEKNKEQDLKLKAMSQ